ncbi:MAG: 4'-phosphopantetheinyl transferase superfamily protein [Bacteroidota bacterium]
MRWHKVTAINMNTSGENLLIVYGTNSLANSLPINEFLTSEEISFSEKLLGEGQKETWVSCRATLRLILGLYLDKKPVDLEFNKSRFGKLSLADSDLFFNISHSQYSFLLAFGYGGRIGIDIELLQGNEDLPALVHYAFSPAETNHYQRDASPKRFTEIWTLKEAFLKAVGTGLVDSLPSITVAGDSSNEITRQKFHADTFHCPSGETGSVVYETDKPLHFIWLC